MDLLVYFWPQIWQKMAVYSSDNLQIFEGFSFCFFWGGRGIFHNFFWLVTSVILILKVALKSPKSDVLKTISSQITLRIRVENLPLPKKLWKIPPSPPEKTKNLREFANYHWNIRPFFAIFGVKIHSKINQYFQFLDVI